MITKQLLCCLSLSLLGIFTTLLGLTHSYTTTAFTSLLPESPIVENSLIARNVSYQKVRQMRSVMFNFQPNVPLEEQDTLLAQINIWDGISKAAHLKPDAKNPAILRMCYAYVNSRAEPEALIERLSALPEIESAFIPAERRLL